MKKLLAILLAAATVAVTTAMTVFAEGESTPAISSITFVKDDDVDINGGILTPGKEYRFRLQYTAAGLQGRHQRHRPHGFHRRSAHWEQVPH